MPPNVNHGGRPQGTKQQWKLHVEIEQGNVFSEISAIFAVFNFSW